MHTPSLRALPHPPTHPPTPLPHVNPPTRLPTGNLYMLANHRFVNVDTAQNPKLCGMVPVGGEGCPWPPLAVPCAGRVCLCRAKCELALCPPCTRLPLACGDPSLLRPLCCARSALRPRLQPLQHPPGAALPRGGGSWVAALRRGQTARWTCWLWARHMRSGTNDGGGKIRSCRSETAHCIKPTSFSGLT